MLRQNARWSFWIGCEILFPVTDVLAKEWKIINKRSGWNLKENPKDFTSFNGITFHSWKESSYSLFTKEH